MVKILKTLHHILILVISKRASLKVKFFHMNLSHLFHNVDDVHTPLARMNIKLNIIVIIEAKFKKHTVRNINLNGYAKWICYRTYTN